MFYRRCILLREGNHKVCETYETKCRKRQRMKDTMEDSGGSVQKLIYCTIAYSTLYDTYRVVVCYMECLTLNCSVFHNGVNEQLQSLSGQYR